MPEFVIFSGWTLSAAYTSASTAWRELCQGERHRLPADVHMYLPLLWWRPFCSCSVQKFTISSV